MILTGIIAISGKPGLFKVVAQGKNNVIVESLVDKKRFPAYAKDRISALEDISIFTTGEDKALSEVFDAIYEKESGKACISHKEDEKKQLQYFATILPDFDSDRVYPSDIKKVYMWYNLLLDSGELKKEEEKPAQEEKEEKKPKSAASKSAKEKDGDATDKKEKPKAAAKPKATKPAATAKKSTSSNAGKPSTAKKASVPKGGTSRGK